MTNRVKQINQTLANFQKIAVGFPEFRYLGDPILRAKAEEVSVHDGVEIGKTLGDILIRYRVLVGYGRGLAAPQVGISRAVFVTYLDNEVQIYINPWIAAQSETCNYYRELCLSSGIIWGDVRRPARITMEWTDSHGKRQTRETDGVLARLWQHEEMHLRGELNVDIALPGSLEIITSDPLKEVLRKQPFRDS